MAGGYLINRSIRNIYKPKCFEERPIFFEKRKSLLVHFSDDFGLYQMPTFFVPNIGSG